MADTKPNPNDPNTDERLTEEIVAYLDGELDPKSAEGVATKLSLDPRLRAEAESLQRTWDILDILPRPLPSSNFTTRTLSQAMPVPAGSASGATIPFGTSGATMTLPAAAPGIGFWLTSAAIVLVAALLGYIGHREFAPPRPAGVDPSLEDVPLMKNLRLYRYVDDLEYLQKLDTVEMFADDSSATSGHDPQSSPDDAAYLRRQSAWFQSQEPRRQQQLRKLHSDFQQLDPDERNRLTRVMQNYGVWLSRLPAPERDRVLAAPNSLARLDAVRSLREAEWIESLPKPYRDVYAQLDNDARRVRAQEWRVEEAERREEWALAQRHWTEHPAGKVPAIMQGDARLHLDAFAGHLRENLNEAEKRDLDEARAATEDFGVGNYFSYPYLVAKLADRHPILPGAVGPKDFDSLPASVKSYLVTNDPQHFRPRGIVPSQAEMKELRRSQGRWPEFAVELSRYCQKRNLQLPVQLGDCRKSEMPPEVIQFLDKVLEPQLRRTNVGKSELETLNKAQGAWPDYPRTIVDMARKYNTSIPGWTLPGSPQVWERFRAGKPRPKS